MGTLCENITFTSDVIMDSFERLQPSKQFQNLNQKQKHYYESVSINRVKTYRQFLGVMRIQIQKNQHIYGLLSIDVFQTIFEELDKYYFSEDRLLDLIKELIQYMVQCLNRMALKEYREDFFSQYAANIRRVWDEAFIQNKNTLRVMNYLVKGTYKDDCYLKLQFNLDPNQSMSVADKTWELCNFDERAFLFLSHYLSLSCINLEKRGMKLTSIQKLLQIALEAICKKYPKSLRDQFKENSIYMSNKTQIQIKFNLNDINSFGPRSNKDTIDEFVLKQVEQAKDTYGPLSELIEKTCKQKGYRFNIRLKIDNQFYERALERVVEKAAGSTFIKYNLQDYSKQNTPIKTIQSFIYQQERLYEIQRQQILSKVNKSFLTNQLNFVQATCFFRSVEDMNDCKQKIKQRIKLSNCQLIEQGKIKDENISSQFLKIRIKTITVSVQLFLESEIADNAFTTRLYEISNSKIFSPFTMLKKVNEQITNSYMEEVVECFQSNNIYKHQYQLIIYSSSITKETFEDISFKGLQKSLNQFLKLVKFSAKEPIARNQHLLLPAIIKQFQTIQKLSLSMSEFNIEEITMKQKTENNRQYLDKIKKHDFCFVQQKRYVKKIERAELLSHKGKSSQTVNQVTSKKAKFHAKMAEMHQLQRNYKMALQQYLNQLYIQETIFGKQAIDCASTHNKIGNVYVLKNLFDQALQSYLKGLQIQQKVLGRQAIKCASTHNSIANVYQNQGLFQKALQQCKKCLQIQEKSFGKQSIKCAPTHNNIGNVYKFQGHYESSLKQYLKCLQIEERVLGKQSIERASTLWNIALVYQKLKDNEQFILYNNRARILKRKYPSHEFPF